MKALLLAVLVLCLSACGMFETTERSNAASNNPAAIVKIAQATARLTACINNHIINFQVNDEAKLKTYRKFNNDHEVSELIISCVNRESSCTLERLDSATSDCQSLL